MGLELTSATAPPCTADLQTGRAVVLKKLAHQGRRQGGLGSWAADSRPRAGELEDFS